MDIDRSIDRVRAVHGALLRCLRYNKRTLALLALGCFIVEIRRELCCGAEILVFNKSVCIGKKERKKERKQERICRRIPEKTKDDFEEFFFNKKKTS
jgi:hypothetical protein